MVTTSMGVGYAQESESFAHKAEHDALHPVARNVQERCRQCADATCCSVRERADSIARRHSKRTAPEVRQGRTPGMQSALDDCLWRARPRAGNSE
eukprot:5589260-Pyramimonas_sp.AAC.1